MRTYLPTTLLAACAGAAVLSGQAVTPETVEPAQTGRPCNAAPVPFITPREADAGAGVSTLAYSNRLGSHVFKVEPGFEGMLLADDVLTTVGWCDLDRYVFRITGDADGDGSGTGPYSVTYGLYETCPGANVDPQPIPGTAGTTEFPDNGVYEIEFRVPDADEVSLPDFFYLGVSFSRAQAGIFAGGLPTVGFSADQFDAPGHPCSASLGGFPEQPHASFDLEVHVRGECPVTFPGYHNSRQSGDYFTPGVNLLFADDLHLAVPECNMVSYSVRVAGTGILRFDLRTVLDDRDPDTGNRIPETDKAWLAFDPGGAAVQVVRFVFDPPIPLPPSVWMTFRTTTEATGPIVAGEPADLGFNEDTYAYHDGTAWVRAQLPAGHAAFDVTIACAGTLPTGACCDMKLTDEQGEAVCRGVPQMNCAFPQLWREGTVCESVCVGGDSDGQPCTRQANCPGGTCPGPFREPCGLSACCTVDGQCADATENECNAIAPTEAPRLYQPGRYCDVAGQRCPIGSCLARTGDCAAAGGAVCTGGTEDRQPCDPDLLCEKSPCCQGGGVCTGEAGCGDPFCCSDVCGLSGYESCCTEHWDAECGAVAADLCYGSPPNDECFNPDPAVGAMLLRIPSMTVHDGIAASENPEDPGFCCHRESPGALGLGTLWYKFVAPPPATPEDEFSSVMLSTCGSEPLPDAPANDSLLLVFEPAEPDRGLCPDGSVCSVTARDCPDGRPCEFDEATACQTLTTIACSDVPGEDCASQPGNAAVCVSNLVPGRTYYAMLAAKDNANRGNWTLTLSPHCVPLRSHLPDDCDLDGLADVCELPPFDPESDCNANGLPDECDTNEDVELAKLTLEGGVADQEFGRAVAVDGDWMLVGAPSWPADEVYGSAHAYRYTGLEWEYETELVPSDGASENALGAAVAVSDGVAVIGAPGADSGAGAAFVFRFVAGLWIEEAKLVGTDAGVPGGSFGEAVAIDGRTIVIGAPYADEDGVAHVYRFDSDAQTWEPEVILRSKDDMGRRGEFGWAVSVHANRIVVGAPGRIGVYYDDPDYGAAYVFKRIGGTWRQETSLGPTAAPSPVRFGESVSIRGTRVVVGAPEYRDLAHLYEAFGAAFVFRLVEGVWMEEATLGPSNRVRDVRFGKASAIRGDALLIGAWDWNPDVASGTVYDYRYVDGEWRLRDRLVSADGNRADDFGAAVAMDDRVAVVGAALDDDACPEDSGCESGSVYVFELSLDCDYDSVPDDCSSDSDGDGVSDLCDNCPGHPNAEQEDCNDNGVGDRCEALECLSDDPTCLDCDENGVLDACENNESYETEAKFFVGDIVDQADFVPLSVSVDGDVAVVGTVHRYNSGYGQTGRVRVYRRVGNTWTEEAQLPPEVSQTSAEFGKAVAVRGNRVVVGAPQYPGPAGVSVFRRSSGLWAREARLVVSNTARQRHAGESVAIDGDTILAGAPWEDANNTSFGAVYVFRFDGAQWTEEAELIAADPEVEGFGTLVSISGDTAVVGALRFQPVHVFRREVGGVWGLEAVLTGDGAERWTFGPAAAISGDTMVVGTPGHRGWGQPGGVDVLEREGTTWTRTARLFPAGGRPNDYAGEFVAIDGPTIVVGAPAHPYDSSGTSTYPTNGTAYVFREKDGVWRQVGGAIGNQRGPYGWSVAISGDTVAVGNPTDRPEYGVEPSVEFLSLVRPIDCNDNGFHDACEPDTDADGVIDDCDNCPGHANADQADCDGDGPGDVCELAECPPDEPGCRDCNGNGIVDECEPPPVANLLGHVAGLGVHGWQPANFVSVSGDAAIAGSPEEDTYHGAAYVYRFAEGQWQQEQRLSLPGPSNDQFFGASVAIYKDLAAVRARGPDHYTVPTYVFRFNGTDWREEAALRNSLDELGYETYSHRAVALDDEFLFVGVTRVAAFGIGIEAGCVLLYRFDGAGWDLESRLAPRDPVAGSYFGQSIALDGRWAFIGAPYDDLCEASASCIDGSVRVFRFNGVHWIEQAKLTASDGDQGWFGWSVALDGDIAVVGAPSARTTPYPVSRADGKVYVFRRHGGDWLEEGILHSGDQLEEESFGATVAVDDDTVYVGAPQEAPYGSEDGPGMVYVYRHTGVGWARLGTIVPDEAVPHDAVGGAMDASNGLLMVGAVGTISTSGGYAHIYSVSGPCDDNGIPAECELDVDGDLIVPDCDNCPDTSNIGQEDGDADGIGDACDNCPMSPNAMQEDSDNDGAGDACDNCPALANAGQADCDADGTGDTCTIANCLGDRWCDDCNDNGVPDGCDLADFDPRATLMPDGAESDDGFGTAVAVSGDVAVVGAKLDAEQGLYAGAAYVMRFDPDAAEWTQEAKLTADDGAEDDRFGSAVASSGHLAAIGAPFDDDGGANAGSVYAFRHGGGWAREAKLTARDAAAGDGFGSAVAVSPDRVVVGAMRDDDAGINSGAAYVFRFDRNAGTWTQEDKLTPDDGAAADFFGQSVAISGDVIVVGASLDDDNGFDSGSAYVFRFNGVEWIEEAKVTPVDGAPADEFGYAVAVSGDTAVVTARRDDDGGAESGSAYVFRFDGNVWVEQTKLVANDAAAGDEFGTSVSIYGDAIVVGANLTDVPGLSSGAAYVYRFVGGAWIPWGNLSAAEPAALDYFGSCVAVSGDLVIVGARGHDASGPTSGAAYAYRLPRDCDADGVPDECHAGDLNGDRTVGLPDFAGLHGCLSGPCGARSCRTPLKIDSCCRIPDFDADYDVDLKDISAFQRAFRPH